MTVLVGQAATDFLRDHWADLYRQDQAATPCQSPAWLTGWASRIGAPATPVTLAVSGSGGPVAALALLRRPTSGGRWEIVPLGSPHSEYVRVVGPGAEEPSTTAAIAAELDGLACGGDRVVLCDVPATSALGRHMMADGAWEQTAVPCAQVVLPVDWTAMSKTTRKAHRRRERVLAEAAAAGHQITYRRSRTPRELAYGYRVLRDLHRRQWPTSDPLTDDWPAVLEHCGPDTAFVASLALDGEPVAAQLCLHRSHPRGDGQHADEPAAKRCYSLRPAMSPDHRPLSPGHALLRLLAADLSAAGFTRLDLGRTVAEPGQAGYKNQYSAGWTYTLTATHTASTATAPEPPPTT